MTMGISTLCYVILMSFIQVTTCQQNLNLFDFFNDPENSLCMGVVCPRESPRCVVEAGMPRCTTQQAQQTRTSNANRLSRSSRPLSNGQQSLYSHMQNMRNFNARSQNMASQNMASQNMASQNMASQSQDMVAQNNVMNNIPRACLQRMQVGQCWSDYPRYFYNTQTGKCQSFTYSGCGANDNNFKDLRDCYRQCILFPQAMGRSGSTGSRTGSPNQGMIRTSQNNNFNGGNAGMSSDRNIFNSNINRNNNANRGFQSGLFMAPASSFSKSRESGSNGGNTNSLSDIFYNSLMSNSGFNTLPSEGSFVVNKAGGSVPSQDPCYLEVDSGVCYASIKRFFYDSKTKECNTFTYGGCQGNANNFESFEQCKRTCGVYGMRGVGQRSQNKSPKSTSLPVDPVIDVTRDTSSGAPSKVPSGLATGESPQLQEICLLSKEPGPCRARNIHYYYNGLTKTCEMFVYSGCGGNQNNFESLANCKKSCNYFENPAAQRRDVAKQETVSIATGSTDSKSKNTLPGKIMSGFAPGAPPPRPTLCHMDADPGPCRASLTRFFFNRTAYQCQRFDYGGCVGNSNNFQTMKDCEQVCDYFDLFVNKQKEIRLELPAKNEKNAQVSKSDQTKSIRMPVKPDVSSITSTTLEQPMSQAPKADSCYLPAKTGPCRAAFRRFFYNQVSGRCELFLYGGCQPNENNFVMEDECRSSCENTATSKSRSVISRDSPLFMFHPNENSGMSLSSSSGFQEGPEAIITSASEQQPTESLQV